MPETVSYEYAVIRVVPSVDRGERINCGVVLYCQSRKFLAALVHVDADRLFAVDPRIDLEAVERHLTAIPRLCAGDESGGEIAKLSLSARFNWLVAPKSAMIQMSPVHAGICAEPESALQHLLESMVLQPELPIGHVSSSQRDAAR